MKKILLCSIAFLGLSIAARAQGVFKLTKKDGASSGFDHVSQKTDAKGNTVMTCTGPGKSSCEFMAAPNTTNPVDYNKIITFVDKQIKEGNYSGNAVVEGQKADWKGSDVFNYTLTVTDPKKNKAGE